MDIERRVNAYELWMTQLRGGISDVEKRQLVQVFGSAEAVWKAEIRLLEDSGILAPQKAQSVARQRAGFSLDENRMDLERSGMRLVTLAQEDYPRRLREIFDAPYGLYYYGRPPGLFTDDVPVIAIVGARTCTGYGRNMGEEIGAALAEAGCAVISGMARGIDQSGHRGCLQRQGRTVAVLGCGADICYPAQSGALYRQIRAEGCVLSEQPPQTPPLPAYFPARNRIISGMADAVLVLEAREKSGSLITADFAMEQGKDVYALPGRVGDPMSAGCNRLISQGAHVITSVSGLLQDLIQLTMAQLSHPVIADTAQTLLSAEEQKVYAALDYYPCNLDEITDAAGLGLLEVLRALLHLQEAGFARECFNNQYIRLH